MTGTTADFAPPRRPDRPATAPSSTPTTPRPAASTATAPTTSPGCSSSPPASRTRTRGPPSSPAARSGSSPTPRASTGRHPQPALRRRALARPAHASRTAGAGASGGSAPPPRTDTAGSAPGRPRRTSSTAPSSARRWPRSMAFAALGAAAVARRRTRATARRSALLADAAERHRRARAPTPAWPWPEPRLTYANAAAPRRPARRRPRPRPARRSSTTGCELLGWLLDRETVDGHLSVTPVGGAGPGDAAPGFDQQPIEVATLADACARAPRPHRRSALGRRRADGGAPGSTATTTPAPSMWDPRHRRRLRRPRGRRRRTTTRARSRRSPSSRPASRPGCSTACRRERRRPAAGPRRRDPARARPVAGRRPAVRRRPGGRRRQRVPGVRRRRADPRPRRGRRAGASSTSCSSASAAATATCVATFSHHADRIGNRLDPDAELSEERWLLLGATFTHEYAIEAASLCNPSIVAHPDQSSAPAGGAPVRHERARHRRGPPVEHRLPHRHRRRRRRRRPSTTPGPFPTLGDRRSRPSSTAAVFHGRLRAARRATARARPTCSTTSTTPSPATSSSRSSACSPASATPGATPTTHRGAAALDRRLQLHARASPPTRDLSERVLCAGDGRGVPRHGGRPLRALRRRRRPSRPTTPPTRRSTASPSASSCCRRPTSCSFAVVADRRPGRHEQGPGAVPRDGSAAGSPPCRAHDRETNAVAFSDTLAPLGRRRRRSRRPTGPGRSIQLGNCGSPIETDAGWLVLTHGVGPDADLQHRRAAPRPRRPDHGRSARCPSRCSRPAADEQDGYVPERRLLAAARCSTATRSSCPTASPTRRSASPPSAGPTCSTAWRGQAHRPDAGRPRSGGEVDDAVVAAAGVLGDADADAGVAGVEDVGPVAGARHPEVVHRGHGPVLADVLAGPA